MSGYLIRPARPSDAEGAAECWVSAFGDDPAFVNEMLSGAALLEHAVCAEAEGRVCSVMFAFDGLGFDGVPASYIYALCTRPEARGLGMGRAVCTAIARQCFDRGAELVCLSPASPALERWYRRTQGFRVLQRSADVPVAPGQGGAACARVGAAEYLCLRRGELALTRQILEAQETIHRYYGGGLYRIGLPGGGTALACAAPQDGRVLVRELLCSREHTAAALGALAAELGKPGDALLLRKRTRQGRALLYLTRDGGAARARPAAVFPFTLE